MIDLNPDTVWFLIDKAREFHAKEAVTIPEEPTSPADDWATQVLADHADDYCYQEMASSIDDLEPDQQICLVALMWLGRGDYDIEDWDAALEHARSEYNLRTADYLIATPMLADYLDEGLRLHGYSDDEG